MAPRGFAIPRMIRNCCGLPASPRRAPECRHHSLFHLGLLPALQASRTDMNETLKGGAATLTAGKKFSHTVLATIQVAFSLAVLVGAGLLARSNAFIQSGRNIDLHHVLGLRLPLSLIHYPQEKAYTFKKEVVRRLRELPGVESVSLAKGQGLVWHFGSRGGDRATQRGRAYAKPGDEPIVAAKQIAPDYFATLKIPFVRTRLQRLRQAWFTFGHHSERNIRASNYGKSTTAWANRSH